MCCEHTLSFAWRSVTEPQGKKDMPKRYRPLIRDANRITTNTFKVLGKAHKLGILTSVENPGSSILWHVPCFKKWAKICKAQRCTFDMGAYQMPFRKRTSVFYAGQCVAVCSSVCMLMLVGGYVVTTGWMLCWIRPEGLPAAP